MFCYYHCCQFWTLKFTVFDVKISTQGCNIYKENIAVKIKLWRGCSHPWADSRINTENLIFFCLSMKQETIWKTFISIWQKRLLKYIIVISQYSERLLLIVGVGKMLLLMTFKYHSPKWSCRKNIPSFQYLLGKKQIAFGYKQYVWQWDVPIHWPALHIEKWAG